MNRIRLIFCLLSSICLLAAAPLLPTVSTGSVTTDSNGNLTGSYATGNKSVTISAGGNLTASANSTTTLNGVLQGTPTGGALSLINLSLTLANNQVSWAWVNKSGSSLADLAARNWSDLQNKPTTVSGAGLTDPFVFTSGSYSDPSWLTLSKAKVGIPNVDDTSDANKPVSTAQQTALNLKVDKTTTVNGHALSGNVTVSSSDVGLGSVANAAQTLASVMPNTAPSGGQIPVGNAGGTTYAPVTVSGDGSLASTGALTITKINGTSLAGLATGLVKNTTSTGVPSIAIAGTDYIAPTNIGVGFAANTINGTANLTGTTGLDFKIVNRAKLIAALSRGYSERVAIVGLGDSNQNFGGAGWGYYFAQQLENAFGCFGTGLLPMGQQFQSQMGQYLSGAGRNNVGANTGAPSQLDNFAPGAIGSTTTVPAYAYVASGDTVTVQGFSQYSSLIVANHPLNLSGNLKYRMSYGTFATGSTSYTPRSRYEQSPFSTLVTGAAINPVTGSYGIVDYTMTLAASSRILNISFEPNTINASMSGPFFGLYMSVENSDATTGLSYQSLVYHAGASLLDFNADLTAFGTTALNEYMRQIKLQLTGSNPSVVIFINSGVNDRNISTGTPSVGPTPATPGNGPAAFADNLQGLVNKLTTSWTANGGSASLIHFCFMVSQPIAQPDDSSLVSYRAAATQLAMTLSNCSAIILPNVSDYQNFLELSWYYPASGNVHLTVNGYQGVCSLIASELAANYLSSAVASGSSVSLTTATAANVTSLSLPAGDWEVAANANFTSASATITATSGGISLTSATVPTDGSEIYSGVVLTTTSEADSISLPRKRINVVAPTTVYLVASRTFSAGTVSAFGSITARRIKP